MEPVGEIEPELSERLEDETEEDDRFKPGETLIGLMVIFNLKTSLLTWNHNYQLRNIALNLDTS